MTYNIVCSTSTASSTPEISFEFITVVTVVIILVIIIVVVVILVIVFKKKQQATKYDDIALKSKEQELTDKEEASSSIDQQSYAVVNKETPPSVPEKSDELVEYLSLKMNQCHDPACTTNIAQGATPDNIYSMPDTASSPTDGGTFETVYSEPLQPSLFTDTVETFSESDNLQPYGPIYAAPTGLPKSDEIPLEVFANNIQEIRELGMGSFGKVILAKTVGLSPKDLKMSKSDKNSKSMLVAIKKLTSGAPSTTKEAFAKEVKNE